MNTEMKKQTALEWFFNQLIDKKNQTPEILWTAYLNAKAMEKEQMVQAWRNGFSSNEGMASYYYNEKYRRTPEKYYNETYGGDK
jgi:hypothetical protein